MKIYTISLNDDGGPQLTGDGSLALLPVPHQPYILRFVVYAWCRIGHNSSLFINVPPDQDTKFERSKYYEHPLKHSFGQETYIDIKITKGGSYSYYFKYESVPADYYRASANAYEGIDMVKTQEFYFIVQSGFELNGTDINLNSLQIQSVMSKLMGPCSTWQPKLKAIADKGYNMVHFTPLQHRGESDSPFSIFNQLTWDPACFPNGETDISRLVSSMEKDHGLLSLSDVVLNHTANNSAWLADHPDAGYSVETAPHLKPALDLDNQLLEFSSNLDKYGLPSDIKSVADLDRITGSLRKLVLEPIRLWEYYVVDVQAVVSEATHLLETPGLSDNLPEIDVPYDSREDLKKLAEFVVELCGQNFSDEYFGTERFVRKICPKKLAAIGKNLDFSHSEVQFRRILDEINDPYYKEYDEESNIVISQLHNRTQYTRLDPNGPKIGPISKDMPLGETYFTRVKLSDGKTIALVNNGWVWAGNPLVDFASNKSRAYLRREVIIWGDCVKLRYGSKPEDSPYLWEHMTKYVELLAKYFHGFRIDNCHSTPLHVGQYLLDKARCVRPNLYVVAELFTGNKDMDKIFVEKLGLNTLIREAMQASSVQELSTLCNINGGRPIGSFSKAPLVNHGSNDNSSDDVEHHAVRSSPIHAWFMDCTHDNEFPAQKRTVEDTLPNAALVTMCSTAVGSTMGYDECYPSAPNVVLESRPYTFGGGISEVKKFLHSIHFKMGQEKADECYLHHEGQYITIHRVEPQSGTGYFLIARTKFSEEGDQKLSDVFLEGTKAECVLSVSLRATNEKFDDDEELVGIPTEVVQLNKPSIEYNSEKNGSIIRPLDSGEFPQGSIAIFKTYQYDVNKDLDSLCRSGASEAVSQLDLIDMNVLLYKVEGEEREYGDGSSGVYDIPNFGPLIYAGLQGWVSILEDVAAYNDLGSPICQNLRDGTWALDYVSNRLEKYRKDFPNIVPVIDWLEERFVKVKKIPSFLRPRYFTIVVFALWQASIERILMQIPEPYHRASIFVQNLALTSVQMVSRSNTASLYPYKKLPSMAAGLPHFSVGFMRCWGRDVFISTPGLLLRLGRYQEARDHILGFAQTLKHGLIPNLLDSGANPRYNARDATWFFLDVVKRYSSTAPDGESILYEKVNRRFPLDDTWVPVDDDRAFKHQSTILEIVYEILARHAAGIQFREANAGPNLDSQMKDEGFNQKIWVDWRNGFVFGGNQWNCGTWMDKMGESEKAGNKGWPGTPRDGAAIEITGLLKATLKWVVQLHRHGKFEWDEVTNQHGDKVKLEEWERLIQNNFERCYYVPDEPSEDSKYDVDPNVIHRRGIYKDIYQSGKPYEDYQLRPNFAIAMCAAPEMFSVKHACNALAVADRTIRGPVGMATLDPADLNYRPYYNNSEDSTDFATSKGRNYHQGPEWLWLTGYFLRALLLFDVKLHGHADEQKYQTLQVIKDRVNDFVNWLRTSPYAGLTELTNKDGEFCYDSSPSQAWSSATLLDLFADGFELLKSSSA